ncbi:hypothetical protein FS749_010312 [Ceratobasidium sp. UAMH 11750]|nr:hypothetical protein FS749_010312 [Ceratobasidium sp. UAMH 11750]
MPIPTPPTAPPVNPVPKYHRAQTHSGFNYEHATGGRAFGEGKHRCEEVDDYMKKHYPGRLWEFGKINKNELLVIELFQKSSLSFKTAKQLFEKIDKEMQQFGGPLWEVCEFSLEEAPNETHVLVFHDLEKCGDHLTSHPDFAGQLLMRPIIQKAEDDSTRIYREMSDGDEWN